MVNQFLSQLQPSLSSARLTRYRSETGDDLETAVNYLWNIALAESLFCSFNATEVALRNGLHGALTQHFGTPAWYDLTGLLDPPQQNNLAQVKKRIADYGDPVTPDRIVSELMFGFWVVILSRPYEGRLWRGGSSAALKGAFLRIPNNKRQRQVIHQQYNEIRELRNRVFHYEPIFDDHQLMRRYGEIGRGLHWLNPRMVEALEWYDRFPDVFAHGRAIVEARLKAKLGIP